MTTYLILINCSSNNQFNKLYTSIQSGRVLLPTPDPLPKGVKLNLKLIFPGVDQPLLVQGAVSDTYWEQDHIPGIIISITESIQAVLPKLDAVASAGSQYRRIEPQPQKSSADVKKSAEKTVKEIPRRPEKKAGQIIRDAIQTKDIQEGLADIKKTAGKGLSFDHIKEIVSQEEIEIDFEKEIEQPEKVIPEKNELTPEEREKAEPVAKFIMNLTKAMLRSGYYDPHHPSAKTAKKGLYDEFFQIAGKHNEISFTNRKSKEASDIFISGVLDQQVNVRILVGHGVAELFVPKLIEYCDRNQLLSFAIKKEITSDHFDQFIDVMSDPMIDRQDLQKQGEYLTNALIERGISEISTVFTDDMIEFEQDLPWRVQMAIHRLAKDLKIMPMFKGVSEEAIRKIKVQTIQEIIRPLNHPKYFNDFLVNCYIISEKVSDVKSEEIENIIVDAFPLHLLLPTSQYTFKELEQLKTLKTEQGDNPIIDKRINGIRRILKMIVSRVTVEKATGAVNFLEQLYRNQILTFKELPVEAQYLVNSQNLCADITMNFDQRRNEFLQVESFEDALVYLKCFRRIAPVLAEEGNWRVLFEISAIINQAATLDIFSSDILLDQLNSIGQDAQEDLADAGHPDAFNISEKFLAYVFMNLSESFICAYENTDRNNHPVLDEILDNLGSLGVDLLSQVLEKSQDKETRKLCVESLVKKGEMTRKWALGILVKPTIPWYVHRNALILLRNVSQSGEDFETVRKYMHHTNSKIREEVITLIVNMRPFDTESLIIKALDDSDARVRWRATRALTDISDISEASIKGIFNIITKPLSDDKDEASEQIKKKITLISAINGLPDIPNMMKVESDILDLIASMMAQEKGIFKMLKRVVASDGEIGVIKAAIPLLGRIGGKPSESALKKLAKTHTQLSGIITKALENIHQRMK